MALQYKKYINVDNTVVNMQKMVNDHFRDDCLRVFDTWPIERVFDYISKEIPYVPDPSRVPSLNNDAVELLKSPEMTMLNGGDCDDKSILAASILERRNKPWRFVVVSTKPDGSLHHVYLEVLIGDEWLPFDATYPRNRIFTENRFTKKAGVRFDKWIAECLQPELRNIEAPLLRIADELRKLFGRR